MINSATALLLAFQPLDLLCLGAALLLFSSLHSLLLGWGHRQETGLGHVLAAAFLQGAGLLAYLALPRLGVAPGLVNLLCLLAAGYGLWALRRYAGLPARLMGWGWLALGSWLVVALAFHLMGFPWALGLLTPILLAILALLCARELGGMARDGGFKLPAQVCGGAATVLALLAAGCGLTAAFLPADAGGYPPQARAWVFFGILAVHQGSVFLLGQVQGQRVQGRLDALVATDPVTGLASAQGFRDHLDRAVGRSLRTGKPSSILVLELDNFAALVAEHGPAPTLRVLEAFAQTLSRTLREADFSGRLEGCRFIALLHQTSPQEALLAGERLRSAWENQLVTLGARVLQSTLSGGMASTLERIEGSSELLVLAISRAASARMAGGNTIEGDSL